MSIADRANRLLGEMSGRRRAAPAKSPQPDFVGAALRLTDADVERVAASLGCEVAALRAVLLVEASSSGFDSKRRPKILFEPHVFWRILDPNVRPRAMQEGLAYPRWGTKPYPKTFDERYTQLRAAMAINEEAALMSASWGLGQVLGANWRKLGYSRVWDMVTDAMQSEGKQLEQMAAFIRSSNIVDELVSKDWDGFAAVYNGPSYKKNRYEVRLADAYARFAAPGGLS